MGWRRHTDGWQAGVVVLLLAGSAVLLGVPRAADPERLPAPRIDTVSLAQTRADDDDLARHAATAQLDVDVRAVGRELRGYNEASAGGDEDAFSGARERVAEAARKAGRFGDQLRELRAYQLVRFLEEIRAWQASGQVRDELRALSGDFLAAAARNRWCGAGRMLAFDERELRVLFKKRWNTIVGAEGEPLALTQAEETVRLGFLLAHPFVANDPVTRSVSEPDAAERLYAPQRLKTIDKLALVDPEYPADLARGVVLFRTGQFQPAAESFRRHLDARPDGPYTLRARNYLKAALDRTLAGPL